MEAVSTDANSGLIFANFNQDFGCFVAVTNDGFRIFNSDPLRQNKTECKSFSALSEMKKIEGENSVYLGQALNDVVNGKAKVVKVGRRDHLIYFARKCRIGSTFSFSARFRYVVM